MATNTTTQNGGPETSIFGRFFVRYTEEFYLLFRLIFAFLVSLHGVQKAFQMWGFPPPGAEGGPPGIVYLAGWVELIVSLLIGLGVLTRLGAGALCVTMVIAYFMMHVGKWPFQPGGGEVAILYFAVAGIIGIMGSRKYGLERLILKKEIL